MRWFFTFILLLSVLASKKLDAESIISEKSISIKAHECEIVIDDPLKSAITPILITQPSRVIIDFHSTTSHKASSFTSPCISKVRFGIHDSFTRVVFDLSDQETTMKLVTEGSKTTIVLLKNNANNETVQTKALESQNDAPMTPIAKQEIIDPKKKNLALLSITPTTTPQPTTTPTSTIEISPTKTPTIKPETPTPTFSPTNTATLFPTLTPFKTPSITTTISVASTQSATPSPSATATTTPSSTSTQTPTLTPSAKASSGSISLLTLIDFSLGTPKGVVFTFNKPTDFRILKASPILLKIIIDNSKAEGDHILKPYFAPSSLPLIESVQVQTPQDDRIVILITLEKNIDVGVYRSGNLIIAEPKG